MTVWFSFIVGRPTLICINNLSVLVAPHRNNLLYANKAAMVDIIVDHVPVFSSILSLPYFLLVLSLLPSSVLYLSSLVYHGCFEIWRRLNINALYYYYLFYYICVRFNLIMSR